MRRAFAFAHSLDPFSTSLLKVYSPQCCFRCCRRSEEVCAIVFTLKELKRTERELGHQACVVGMHWHFLCLEGPPVLFLGLKVRLRRNKSGITKEAW